MSSFGFTCSQYGEHLQVRTPFAYWNGDVVRFFIEDLGARAKVTDYGDALMMAQSYGVKINKKKRTALQAIANPLVTIADNGEISASVAKDDIEKGAIGLLDVLLATSHFFYNWQPAVPRPAFNDEVDGVLRPACGERLERNVSVQGGSGHQYTFPFRVQSQSTARYIDTIPSGPEGFTWKSVPGTFTRMMDLMNADVPDDGRFVIVDDAFETEELKSAITLLSGASNVLRFSKSDQWIERVAA